MACYNCGSDFCYGNCNNNVAGGILLIAAVMFLPYIPFSVLFYEIFSFISGGYNIIKWAGAFLGGYLGYKIWIIWFPRYTQKYIKSSFLYWFIVYIISIILFFILDMLFTSNIVVYKITTMFKYIFFILLYLITSKS